MGNPDRWHAEFNRPMKPVRNHAGHIVLILIAFCIGTGAAGSFTDPAAAQVQTDQLSKQLGTVRTQPSLRAREQNSSTSQSSADSKGAAPIRVPLTIHAGESMIIRAGASTLTQSGQPAAIAFKLGRKPACGDTRETPQGIVLATSSECAGLTLEFDYEVSLVGVPASQQSAGKVEVQALVLSGVESCGIADAPYEFIRIPGGSYTPRSFPGQLGDLADLIGTKVANVEAFCMTEEAIPAAEMEAFLAAQTFAQKRRSFPEALDTAVQVSAQVEMGRGLRVPALAISHRMAHGYAEKQSGLFDRKFELPLLEHYVAAAVHLLRQQPDAPATHSFLVSLRGGLMEWTDTPCDAVSDAYIVLGTKPQSGLLEKYCYEVSQRVARMGFRLIARTRWEGGASPQSVR